MRRTIRSAAFLLMTALGSGLMAAAQTAPAAANAKMKVIFDTDIGDDIDDVFALALLVTQPNVELLGVTTAWGRYGAACAAHGTLPDRDRQDRCSGVRGTADHRAYGVFTGDLCNGIFREAVAGRDDIYAGRHPAQSGRDHVDCGGSLRVMLAH